MSKLKVDEIRSDRSVSSTANITLADDGKVNFVENLVIANGKGIDFSAVSGSASGSSSALKRLRRRHLDSQYRRKCFTYGNII